MINKIEDVQNLIQTKSDYGFLALKRIDFNGLRLYVKDEPFIYFSGLTGALSRSTFKGDPNERRLQSWREAYIDEHGLQTQKDYVEATADFGTLVHEALVIIEKNGGIDWNEEKDRAEARFFAMMIDKGQNPSSYVIRKMVYAYQKHVASIMQFIYERVEEIYGVEVPALWPGLKIATPIDLIGKIRQTPKADAIRSVVNIKTSNQIMPSHLDQVCIELLMWNTTYRHLQCGATGILRTKDWREGKDPSYEYKYIKRGAAYHKARKKEKQLLLCLDSDASYYPDPSYKMFVGSTKIGERPEIQIIGIEQEWNRILELKKEQGEDKA